MSPVVALATDIRQACVSAAASTVVQSANARLLRAGDERRDQIDREQPGEPGNERGNAACHVGPQFTWFRFT